MMHWSRFLTGAATVAVCGLSAALLGAAPGGDLSKQQPKYHIEHIPPAPIQTPEQELKSFKVPAGFHVELVAAEPMVEEPIALTFDPDGRIYVVELRAYMPDIKGTGELDPIGRIVRLESSKRDGVYDKRTIFLDKLVIPRAVGLAGDGVLVAEPPNVWFCRDTNGDGVCDEKKPVFTDYGSRNPNPEHMANGLVRCLDNWYYNADWSARFRFAKGQFLRDAAPPRGQWGIAQDDVGRLFYNTNGSMLRCDYVPAQYLTRNPYLPTPPGVNVQIASNATFPSRVNPGVNRGYTADVNSEGKLQRVTAACGPTVYRGAAFPEAYRGNAFACEPAGNLISRQVLSQDGVTIKAKSFQHDGIDFFTSTDERCRPVSTYTAPDGSLYVIDLYHGILQHKAYLSAYLADQVEKRHLDENGGHRGRIWRIVPDGFKPGAMPQLSKASSDELVKTLSHPNGWWRDTAQRLLVERQDPKSVPMLEKVIDGSAAGATPLAKVHALWTLQGMDKLEDGVAADALKDPDARVRLAALRAGETLVRKKTGSNMIAAIPALANDPSIEVQLQVLLLASPDLPQLQAAANGVLERHMTEALFRGAALNAATGRELEVLDTLLKDKAFAASSTGKTDMLNDLAECVTRSRSADRISGLLDFIAAQPASAAAAKEAMLSGMTEAIGGGSAGSGGKSKTTTKSASSTTGMRHLRLPHEPKALAGLVESKDQKVSALAKKVEAGLSWPNKPGDKTPPLTPLTPEQEKRFAAGREVFSTICAQCHQPSGLGMEGVAPPLVDSEWVLGPQERVVRIVLNGLHGPVKVGKKTVDLEMPGLKTLDDEQLASILTYIRREWGHEGKPIEPATVTAVRKATADRGDLQWTAEELQQLGGEPASGKTDQNGKNGKVAKTPKK